MEGKKLVFVTGGSKGIGRGIVIDLLENNYNVAIGYKTNSFGAKKLAKKCQTIAIKLDIKNRKSIKNAIKECKIYFKKDIDILINNAAISQEKSFEKITDKDWDLMMVTNLRGAFSFSQEVIRTMIKKRWGRIINIVSIGGQWGGTNQIHYAASKAGMINLTMSLAKNYSKYGITVNAVSPSLVLTDMTKNEIRTKKGKQKIKSIPMRRIGNIEEIANVVKFICSEDSSYISGQTINVNGGMYFG